jgi:hypothetical protein
MASGFWRPFFLLALFIGLSPGLMDTADAKRKRRGKGPPPAGWSTMDEGQPDCYQPPVWADLQETERRIKRAEVLDELLAQWRGARNDGVNFGDVVVERAETTLLGRPDRIEEVVTKNAALCAAGDTGAWNAWAKALPKTLTVGECNTPLDYTMFDYLDIEAGWQRPLPICKGNRVVIKGSSTDKYRIQDDGPWITVSGDPSQSTAGSDWPCNMEGCIAGVLMGRFVGESGTESIFVVGSQINYTAPEHGEISYRIYDKVFYDNAWYQSGGLVDHTSIEVSPAK